MTNELNYPEFQTLLLNEARKAFVDIQQAHPDETFYAFSLFHAPLWEYIIPTSNSEEGLLREAAEYKLDKYNLSYKKWKIPQLARSLRWSPADWAYHYLPVGCFEEVNEWLVKSAIYDKFEDESVNDRMLSLCRSVMKTLDSEGIFGAGKTRDQVVLNIMMGDQDSSWYGHAQALNSPAVYERWKREVRQMYTVSRMMWRYK